MSKGERHGNRESKKPKKLKPKVIAAAPSIKATPIHQTMIGKTSIKK